MISYFLYYILIINLYSIIVMYLDKEKSKKHKWRIPEKKLFLIALLFGSPGIYIGMKLFRHKTKHEKFTLGIPMIIILQIILIVYFYLSH